MELKHTTPAASRASLRGKSVAVIGAARSGLSAARVLAQLGAEVVISDSKTAEAMADAAREMEAAGIRCRFGAAVDEALPAGIELVITSPGAPKTAPVLEAAAARRIPIWSEIELAYRVSNAPIVATTGTNGKTTTTLLIAAMLEGAGPGRPVVCGNISADDIKKTAVDAAFESTAEDVLIAEISSFQLEWVDAFAPRVAVLTNVTPDHLNRHSGFDDYVATKARLFAAQAASDWAIVGYDNPASRSVGESGLAGRRVWFTVQSDPPDAGPLAWVDDGVLTVRLEPDGPANKLLSVTELPAALPGAHSIANVLAAASAALAMGAGAEAIANAVRGFAGVAHRMEWVADIDGVRYINNSMCTNVAAAVCSLQAMDRPTIVIAGGADKDLDFTALTPVLRAKAKCVILIGSAAEKMEATFRSGGCTDIARAGSLPSAVELARSFSVPGDAVLLSPACASFDMFRDFEHRGAVFREAVRGRGTEVRA